LLYLDTETDLAPAFAVVGVGNERERSEKLPKTWTGMSVVPGSGEVDSDGEAEDGGLSLLILISGVAAVVVLAVPPNVDVLLVPGAGTEGTPRSNGSADSCAGGERLITGCMIYAEEMTESVRIVTRFDDIYRNGNWNSNSDLKLTRTDPPKLNLLNTPCPRSTLPSTSPIPEPGPELEVEFVVAFPMEFEDGFSACPVPDEIGIDVEVEVEEKAAETPLIPFIPTLTFDFGPDELGMAIVDKVGEVEEVEPCASVPPTLEFTVELEFEGEDPNPNPGVKGLFQSAVALAEMMGGEIGPVNPRFRLEYVGLTIAFKLLLLLLLLTLLRLEPRLRFRFRLFSFLWWLMVIGTGTGEGGMVRVLGRYMTMMREFDLF
jgi:hypothetical protein